jgi:hypothetical protein
MAEGYSELPNERVSAANGVDYAYRDTAGDGQSGDGLPLVLLQHFRGNPSEPATQAYLDQIHALSALTGTSLHRSADSGSV